MPLSATRRGQGRAAAGGRARAALALGLFLAAARPPRLAGEDAPLPGSPLAGGPRGVLGGWPGGSLGAARSPFGPGGAAGPGGLAASLGSAAAGQVEGGDPGAQIEAVGSGAGAAGSGGAKEASFLDDPSLVRLQDKLGFAEIVSAILNAADGLRGDGDDMRRLLDEGPQVAGRHVLVEGRERAQRQVPLLRPSPVPGAVQSARSAPPMS